MQPASLLCFQRSASNPPFLFTPFAVIDTRALVCECTRARARENRGNPNDRRVRIARAAETRKRLCALRQIVGTSIPPPTAFSSGIAVHESSGGELAALTLNRASAFRGRVPFENNCEMSAVQQHRIRHKDRFLIAHKIY